MDYLSLSELNQLVKCSIRDNFPETYWLMAETSDVRENHKSGHCYLEFIEKNELSGATVARARAYIWNNTFRILKPYFEQIARQPFSSGLKVLVRVGIDFHELYGYGLTVYDLDPTYTLGDMERKKQEIIRQLEEEGVLNLNKELEFPALPQRIAIISSPTAAGYEDFMNHLLNNNAGFVFYPRLFPAVMQGEQTEESVIASLNRIYEYKEHFDLVVIIRGGGATSELASFDSYLLAANCAQFPLPVLTGIGHERDDTILDLVAWKRAKTPTAVADFLIQASKETYESLLFLRDSMITEANHILTQNQTRLKLTGNNFTHAIAGIFEKKYAELDLLRTRLGYSTESLLNNHLNKLAEKETFIKLSSPEYILAKGYSITLKDGKPVKDTKNLKKGDQLQTKLFKGEFTSKVE